MSSAHSRVRTVLSLVGEIIQSCNANVTKALNVLALLPATLATPTPQFSPKARSYTRGIIYRGWKLRQHFRGLHKHCSRDIIINPLWSICTSSTVAPTVAAYKIVGCKQTSLTCSHHPCLQSPAMVAFVCLTCSYPRLQFPTIISLLQLHFHILQLKVSGFA